MGDVLFSTVDADDADRYRIASGTAKMVNLSRQIADYPVDLLDHRLRENLDFDADFDGRYFTALDAKPGGNNRVATRHGLTKRRIAAAGDDAA